MMKTSSDQGQGHQIYSTMSEKINVLDCNVSRCGVVASQLGFLCSGVVVSISNCYLD